MRRFSILAFLVLGGCGGATTSSPPGGSAGGAAGAASSCIPNQQIACGCPGTATPGIQVCAADGSKLGPCLGCLPPGVGAGGQGGSVAGPGGSPAGPGGSPAAGPGGAHAGGQGGASSPGAGGQAGVGAGPGAGGASCGASPDVDADHDGWTPAQGDCNDCDPDVNPGAVDFLKVDAQGAPLPPDQQVDSNCDGVLPGAATSCDAGLGPALSDPFDGARAMGLCNVKVDESPADPKKRTWGVVKAQLSDIAGPFLNAPVQHSSQPMELDYGLLPDFGAGSKPREGSRLFALSTGEARTPSQPGFIAGQQCMFDKGYTDSYPPGFPKNGSCGMTGTPHDGVALDLQIRVPTNARSFSFDFRFFTCEYPMFACMMYNDIFAVLMGPDPLPPGDPMGDSSNSSADVAFVVDPATQMKSVIGVNNQAFFTACTPGPVGYTNCKGESELQGSGFETHGASAWIHSQVPLPPPPVHADPNAASAATIYLRFAIWDSLDGVYDSTALVDNFAWSPDSVQTGSSAAGP